MPEPQRARIAAPQHPAEARRAAVADARSKAQGRGRGNSRTPAEVDEVLDLILARLDDLDT